MYSSFYGFMLVHCFITWVSLRQFYCYFVLILVLWYDTVCKNYNNNKKN